MVDEDRLIRYLAQTEKRRTDQVVFTLETLTPREALLVREAAVAGYVSGQMDASAGFTDIPRDLAILHTSILTCISQNGSNPNHFKLIGAAAEGLRPRTERGSWR